MKRFTELSKIQQNHIRQRFHKMEFRAARNRRCNGNPAYSQPETWMFTLSPKNTPQMWTARPIPLTEIFSRRHYERSVP